MKKIRVMQTAAVIAFSMGLTSIAIGAQGILANQNKQEYKLVAGVSAAINLKIRKKNFLLIGSKEFSAKVQKAELIQNYVGMPDVSGCELSDA